MICRSKALKKKPTRAQQKEMRPGQILDAAFAEFSRKGYAATRVEDIADQVGVTKGTVYFYFETKEALFEAAISHVSESMTAVIDNPSTNKGTPCERLAAVLNALYDVLLEDPRKSELLRLVISEGQKFPDIVERHDEQAIKPILDKIQAIVDEGINRGDFRANGSCFPELIMSPVMMLAVMSIIFGNQNRIDVKSFRNSHVDLIVHGLLSHS